MKRTLHILLSLLALMLFSGNIHASGRASVDSLVRDSSASARRLKSYTIIPRGDWQIGMAASYMNISTDNSDYLLIIDGSTANASILDISLQGGFAYMNNQTAGLRFKYSTGHCAIDASTLDLLGNFSLEIDNIRTKYLSYSAFLFNRSYIGLDRLARVGFFIDAALGYVRSRTDIFAQEVHSSYSTNDKFSLVLSPGIVYFPMNNVSIFASVSLAEISYNHSKGFKDGVFVGDRRFFKAQSKLNLLALSFGITVHL